MSSRQLSTSILNFTFTVTRDDNFHKTLKSTYYVTALLFLSRYAALFISLIHRSDTYDGSMMDLFSFCLTSHPTVSASVLRELVSPRGCKSESKCLDCHSFCRNVCSPIKRKKEAKRKNHMPDKIYFCSVVVVKMKRDTVITSHSITSDTCSHSVCIAAGALSERELVKA